MLSCSEFPGLSGKLQLRRGTSYVKQESLAESMLVEHDALLELDSLMLWLTGTVLEGMLFGIHTKSREAFSMTRDDPGILSWTP